jgi:penicillin-binding protein 2
MSSKEMERTRVFTRRALLLGAGQTGLFAVLAGRLYYLQVMQAGRYRLLAEDNRVNVRLIAPLRGDIVDRFGVKLAANSQNYRVVLVPEQTEGVAATLKALGRLVPISDQQSAKVLREAAATRSFMPVLAAENLNWEQFASVNVNSPDLPGVQPEVGHLRFYPHGAIVVHAIGYVGAVSEKELGDDPLLRLPGFRIGKAGVEKSLDRQLRGKAGDSQVEVNAYGRTIRELARDDGRPGAEAVLTLDLDVQRYVMGRLAGQSAAAIVLDVDDGEVLALASVPSYDPNLFTLGLSTREWQALANDPMSPLVDKAAAGQYPPGSTFKPVVALAGLETGVIGPEMTVFCNGTTKLGSHVFHCWKRGGHGWVNLRMALAQSCDCYFYEVSRRLGIDQLAAMANRLGFGTRLGIELPNEKPGLVPTRAWKEAHFHAPWQQGETLIAGIGQGFMLSTPLQLATLAARIANGSAAVRPTLVRFLGGLRPRRAAPSLGISRASLDAVRDGMDAVVNSMRGTAYKHRLDLDGMTMAGKTGTSQVRRISRTERLTGVIKNENLPWKERDHALFIAYAPVDRPRYATAVLVEHGGSGSSTAAPIARDILQKALSRDPMRLAGYVPEAKPA